MEQQLEEAQTENFNIKQMKDLFEQKAAQLATEIAGKLNQIFLANDESRYLFAIVHPGNKALYFSVLYFGVIKHLL